MRVTFLGNASRFCSFLFRIFVSYQVHPKIFMVCPAGAFNLICQLSMEENSLDLSFGDTQPRTFLPSEQQLLLEYHLYSTSR